MNLIDPIVTELDREARTTHKVLSAVPQDKLAWKPHAKSMSLGSLAWHLATLPRFVASVVTQDGHDFATSSRPPVPDSVPEILQAFEANVASAREVLASITDAQALASWNFILKGKVMMSQPRLGFVRTILLNHTYHHRGQLTVYLRLLDVPVPAVYGPSADDNPFA